MADALVLGGSGQIGQAAVRALLVDGWDVRVLCRGSGDHAGRVRAWGAEPVLGDRHDPAALDRALGAGVDVLVDAIAYDDRDAAQVLAYQHRVGSAVVVSSAAVYADGAGRSLETEEFPDLPEPVGEEQATVAPGRTGYAGGKAALEQAWLGQHRVPATVLRPGAIHGPGCVQPREWTFVKRALDSRAVRVLAFDGESRFHTTSSAVLGELIRLAAAAPGTRVLNAVDPQALTVAEIGAAVHAAMGHDAETVAFSGPPRGNVGLTPWAVPAPVVLDMAAAARELGYVAPGTYEQTVGAAVEWLLAAGAREDWRTVFPGVARMEAGRDFFDYAAEDDHLARAAR
ncbi:NAD-dependent epimerase/dehydratase family protein [Cellulomonas timonensis]|uniref:NAD-dependent epimerase/dehydratase family protein n=1 Tax=Cellulomonas timonensis TaxID=1689271 RepID=UPI000AAF77DE|nr:NAD-dependent epimerase/dehydratase family protein [Cellulomonas timonensis]